VPLKDDNAEILFELAFPACPDRLKLVRSLVLEAARMSGLCDASSRDLVIAVDEACQNVIRHAYCGDPEGKIILEFARTADSVVLKLRDFAPSADVEKIKPRDLDDIRPGGLGTHFIFKLMDEATFAPPLEGDGNLLKMVKRIG